MCWKPLNFAPSKIIVIKTIMTKAIRNVRVFNGTVLTEMTNVVFESGYITSVGPAVPPMIDVIDGKGKALLPGQISADNQRLHINSEAIEPGRKANFVLANVLKPQKSIAQFEHAWVAGVQVQ